MHLHPSPRIAILRPNSPSVAPIRHDFLCVSTLRPDSPSFAWLPTRLYPSPRLAILTHDILCVCILRLDSPSFVPINNLQMLEMDQILTKVTNALGTSRQGKLQKLRMLIEAHKDLPTEMRS